MYRVTEQQAAATLPGTARMSGNTDLLGFPEKYLDVPYVNDGLRSHRLNVVLPKEGKGPFPLIVFIHGGGWLAGDKNHAESLSACRLLYAGYAVSCINYRLSGEAKFPQNLYDCKAAIRFLRANSEKFNIDARRIGVIGNSAGGHLAALLGTTNGKPEFEDLSQGNPDVSSAVQAVFVWYGIYDFLNWRRDWETAFPGRPFDCEVSMEAFMFGHSMLEHPERLAMASPVVQLDKNAVPFFVEYGTGDHAVPWPQTPGFYKRYTDLLGDENIGIVCFEGAEHLSDVYKTDENVFRFVTFFDRHILQRTPRDYFRLGTLGVY